MANWWQETDLQKRTNLYNKTKSYSLDKIRKSPNKYTEGEIRKAYSSLRPSKDDYQRTVQEDDSVFSEELDKDRYNSALNKYNIGLNRLLISAKATPAPAPKPKAAPAPKPKPVATDNTYRKESEALLKTIDALTKEISKPPPAPPPPPKTIFGSSTSLSPSNLQIAPAAGINKMSGTSSFKRRTTSPSTFKVRTIQSLNV